MSEYGVAETGMRALGFGSGREAEIGAANSAFYRQSKGAAAERAELMNTWAQAKPEKKASALTAITKWNMGKPEEEKIKMKDLTAKLKRDDKANKEARHGVVANKRDKRFLALNRPQLSAGMGMKVASVPGAPLSQPKVAPMGGPTMPMSQPRIAPVAPPMTMPAPTNTGGPIGPVLEMRYARGGKVPSKPSKSYTKKRK